MMDRNNRDRDNASGRTLHTYTPRSHEDLLRSHLQLDATRNARLQNELQRLADENKRLRRDLDDARKDVKDKEDEIDDLKKKLREKPKAPPSSERSSVDEPKVFEIDGKPVTLDQILNHFDGVIQKHHDLLDKKNRQIDDLEDALRNRPKQPPKSLRNAETQALGPREDPKQDDFVKELAMVRKEYDQVERILTDRNNKLENLIEDLRRKLDQYADEIGHLRRELASRGMDPNESTMKLLKEKEKENDYLKDLINNLQRQPQSGIPMALSTNNEDLENEIKKIIEDKKNAVKKLSNMIIDLKKTPSGNVVNAPDMSDLEKECNNMIGDLNNMNDKLNNVLLKLRQKPQTVQGDPMNKDDLLNNLKNLKKQCENEIEALKSQLHKTPSETPVVLTGHGQLRIDDPEILKRTYPDRENRNEPVSYPSNIQFYLYPTKGTPVRQQPERARTSEPNIAYEPGRAAYEPVRYQEPDPTPESSLKSFRPVNYRPVTPESSYVHFPIKPKGRLYPELPSMPRERLYPEIPSETHTIAPKPRPHSPFSCEACQEDYIPPRTPHDDQPLRTPRDDQPVRTPRHDQPPDKPPPRHQKPKKKGCCGGKGSETSNIPYEKSPAKEEIMYIHQPEQSQHKQGPKPNEDSPKPKKKLVSKLKPDRHKESDY